MSDGEPGDSERRVPLFHQSDRGVERSPGGVDWQGPGSPTIVQMPPRQSDEEIAATFRLRALEALEELNKICTQADRAGFVIGYSTGQDGIGKYMVTQLRILKKMG